jgi:hypothetical protein
MTSPIILLPTEISLAKSTHALGRRPEILTDVLGGLGQDFSVGYASHDRDKVELYLTESFTFRVLEPAAAVVALRPAPVLAAGVGSAIPSGYG